MKLQIVVIGAVLLVLVAMVLLGVYAFHMSWWIAVPVAIGAMLVNGWIATWEDELPGGFNNPLPHRLGPRPDRNDPRPQG